MTTIKMETMFCTIHITKDKYEGDEGGRWIVPKPGWDVEGFNIARNWYTCWVHKFESSTSCIWASTNSFNIIAISLSSASYPSQSILALAIYAFNMHSSLVVASNWVIRIFSGITIEALFVITIVEVISMGASTCVKARIGTVLVVRVKCTVAQRMGYANNIAGSVTISTSSSLPT